jgi:hypothetical protein
VFVLAILIWGMLVVVAAVVTAAVLLVGWQVVDAFALGATTTLLATRARGWNKDRHLHELCDWLNEDLDARKLADLRDQHAQARLGGRLP